MARELAMSSQTENAGCRQRRSQPNNVQKVVPELLEKIENLWVDQWALLPAVFKSQDWGRGPEANWAVSRDIITWRRNEEARCLQIGSQSVKEKNYDMAGLHVQQNIVGARIYDF
jgi:hypothetical protein